MRSFPAVALILACLLPAAAAAQTAGPTAGSVEVTGVTALTVNNQTISPKDEDGDLDVKNASAAAGIHFYLSNRLAIGVAGGFTQFSAGVEDSEITASTIIGGPQLRYRFGSSKTALVLVGGGGLTKLKLDASGDDLEGVDAGLLETTGWFWEAGADVSFLFRDNLAFNIGARYQSTRSKDQDDFEFDTAGISVGVGFSFFIGGR